MKTLPLLIALLLFLVGARATAQDAPAKAEPASPTPSPAPKTAAPIADTAKAPAPERFIPTGANFVANDSFEAWDGKMPRGWALRAGAGENWADVPGKQSANAGIGSVSLSIPPANADQTVVASQKIALEEIPEGARMFLGASIKAEGASGVALRLEYALTDGTRVTKQVVHPGDGDWHKLAEEFWISQEVDSSSFEVKIIRHPSASGVVLLDDVLFQFMAPAPEVAVDPNEKPRTSPASRAHGFMRAPVPPVVATP